MLDWHSCQIYYPLERKLLLLLLLLLYGYSPPTADLRRAVVRYWRNDVYSVLVKRLGLSLPRKSVVRLTDRLDMTIVVEWDVKPQNNNSNNNRFRYINKTSFTNNFVIFMANLSVKFIQSTCMCWQVLVFLKACQLFYYIMVLDYNLEILEEINLASH